MNYEFCCDTPTHQLEEKPFSDEFEETYIEEVFAGIITVSTLSLAYHERVGGILAEPVVQAVGAVDDIAGPERLSLALDLRTNTYEMAAAKQYTQVRQMAALAAEPITFQEYKEHARETFQLFNESYLRTEFNTSVSSMQNTESFIDALETADDFPLVQYITQRDNRVRPTHRELDGITLPITHHFWRRYWPPNGWNCRCFVIKLESGEQTDLSRRDFAEIRKDTPEEFRQNPALSGMIFDKTKHPYFTVAPGDSQLRDNNFNLPRGPINEQ